MDDHKIVEIAMRTYLKHYGSLEGVVKFLKTGGYMEKEEKMTIGIFNAKNIEEATKVLDHVSDIEEGPLALEHMYGEMYRIFKILSPE